MPVPAFSASVCVFCGSRPGLRPAYQVAATETGEMLARRDWRLVYGAGDVGLMGAVARAAQGAGGASLGVIPRHLVDLEAGRTDLASCVVTETMHERKKVMFMNADAIVMLPGGAGSLDEFFEVLTWRQLGLHDKPILLLDVEGYWQPLRQLLNHVIDEGFANDGFKAFVQYVSSTKALEKALDAAFAG